MNIYLGPLSHYAPPPPPPPAARFRFTPWPRFFFIKLQRTCWIQSLRLFILWSRASGAPYEIVSEIRDATCNYTYSEWNSYSLLLQT